MEITVLSPRAKPEVEESHSCHGITILYHSYNSKRYDTKARQLVSLY